MPDNNSVQSEQRHIGLVCYVLHCRLVAVADDNKVVVGSDLQSSVLQTVFLLPNERSVHNL